MSQPCQTRQPFTKPLTWNEIAHNEMLENQRRREYVPGQHHYSVIENGELIKKHICKWPVERPWKLNYCMRAANATGLTSDGNIVFLCKSHIKVSNMWNYDLKYFEPITLETPPPPYPNN